jgi:hypothetical protein
MKTIKKLHTIVEASLFSTKGDIVSYDRTIDAIVKLCDVLETNIDESVWSIGESSTASLDDLIVGAYWFFADYHNGQRSKEYAALCALGRIFKPGMSSGCGSDSCEEMVYQALETKLNGNETK